MSGKKFADALKKFDREFMYAPKEAVTHAKNTATAAFDESIDVVIRLGVDPRKADQMVRGTVALPAGTGKNVRIAVFAAGEAADAGLVGRSGSGRFRRRGSLEFDRAASVCAWGA